MNAIRPNVLAIDDDHDAADTMAILLKCWGYNATAFYSGFTALAAVRVKQPTAMLVDLGMVPMNGYDLVAQVRTIQSSERILIIAISGHVSEAHQSRARDLGIYHYFFKPTDLCGLELLLLRLLCKPIPIYDNTQWQSSISGRDLTALTPRREMTSSLSGIS
ncbi:hypothetical protein BH11PLA2_BH11PLA2_41020 [soil metagenome]